MTRLLNQQNKSIEHAKLTWNDQGEPSSPLFDDIYFSTSNGLAESLYVFIEQNKLHQRWLACQDSFYVIGETGFGSGLNLLVTWQAFDKFCQDNPDHVLKRLHFISFEKYPLTQQDLFNAHARWPQLSEPAKQLQAQYPMAIAGCHRLNFTINESINSQLVVDLWIGDINQTISQIACPKHGVVDSWYLDGFAPTKNPDMWHQGLYDNMAKLSKNNASLATFTAAGDVRRGLQQSGFLIKKVKGFGKKREMITASFKRDHLTTNLSPWFNRPALAESSEDTNPALSHSTITIIGGGIASASIALALAKRGINSRVVCQDSMLAQGASGNLQGGFYPLVNGQNDQLSQFYTLAFGFGLNYYSTYCGQTNTEKMADFCGVVQVAHNEKIQQAHDKLINSGYFPADLVAKITHKQASAITGIELTTSALHYPHGGWLSPKLLTKAIIEHAQTLASVDIQFQTDVQAITKRNGHWQLSCNNSGQQTTQITSEFLVLANGHGLSNFEQTQHLPFYATAGQVSHIQSFEALSPLKTVLCYQGYLTPQSNNMHCLGASFNRDITDYAVNDNEHAQNIEKLTTDIPLLTNANTLEQHTNGGKVGVRMSVKDHLPMMGSVPNYEMTKNMYSDLSKGKPDSSYENSPVHQGLFMLGGLGSRGLCSAPLLAELLACQLTGEPMPLPLSLLNQLNPNRYWIKQLKKHHVDI